SLLGGSVLIGAAAGAVVGGTVAALSSQDDFGSSAFWDQVASGAGSGALVGGAVGLAIDTWGVGAPISAAIIGAGIGAGVGSAAGSGLLSSGRGPTSWEGFGKGAYVGGALGASAGLAVGNEGVERTTTTQYDLDNNVLIVTAPMQQVTS